MRVSWHWIAAAYVIAAPTPAAAQTQAQQDRLDQAARFLVTAPMCQRLGMTLEPDLPAKFTNAIEAETTSWLAAPATVKRLLSEASSRQVAILKTDLKAASDGAKTAEQLKAVKAILLGYGSTCIAATSDPIFSSLITAPPQYNLDKAATEAADSMLASGGLASWQTPKIQARGDLMMLAGACRSKIGPARSDALVSEFGKSDDPRVRDYYSKSFDEGFSDPSMISTLEGCNKAIASYQARAR